MFGSIVFMAIVAIIAATVATFTNDEGMSWIFSTVAWCFGVAFVLSVILVTLAG